MKYLISIIMLCTLAGCSIGYDAADSEANRRQDLIGYILNLKDDVEATTPSDAPQPVDEVKE